MVLDEIKTVLGKKKVFIVTDQFLYANGYTKPVTDKWMKLVLSTQHFMVWLPIHTGKCKGRAKLMSSFEPDCIIAISGDLLWTH